MDINGLVSSLDQIIHQAGSAFEEQMNAKNISDPESMLRAQFAMQQYSSLINYESAVVKNVKDLLSGIISKI